MFSLLKDNRLVILVTCFLLSQPLISPSAVAAVESGPVVIQPQLPQQVTCNDPIFPKLTVGEKKGPSFSAFSESGGTPYVTDNCSGRFTVDLTMKKATKFNNDSIIAQLYSIGIKPLTKSECENSSLSVRIFKRSVLSPAVSTKWTLFIDYVGSKSYWITYSDMNYPPECSIMNSYFQQFIPKPTVSIYDIYRVEFLPLINGKPVAGRVGWREYN